MGRDGSFPPGCAVRFEPVRQLAQGGFATVWIARQRELDRPVAVKLLHDHYLEDPTEVARFRDEARITAQLRSPYIVTVLDFDVEDGVPWIAFELLPGRTLHDRIARGALPPGDAIDIAIQITFALEDAHAHGVIHRDVQPANLIDAGDGLYKLTDFGIAKWASAEHALTRTGCVPGTVTYLAPELVEGTPPSPQSDLYALGVLLFHMLTGRAPFTGNSPLEVCRAHLEKQAPAPGTRVAGLTPEVDRLVLALLAKRPGERPKSAASVRQELIRVRRTLPSPGRSTPSRARVTRRFETVCEPAPRRRAAARWSWALGAAVALALGLAAWAPAAQRSAPAPVPAPATVRASQQRDAESAARFAAACAELAQRRAPLVGLFKAEDLSAEQLRSRLEENGEACRRLVSVLEALAQACPDAAARAALATARACAFSAWAAARRVEGWAEMQAWALEGRHGDPRRPRFDAAGVPLLADWCTAATASAEDALAAGDGALCIALLEDIMMVARSATAEEWGGSDRARVDAHVRRLFERLAASPGRLAAPVRRVAWYLWAASPIDLKRETRRFYRESALDGLRELQAMSPAAAPATSALMESIRAAWPDTARTL